MIGDDKSAQLAMYLAKIQELFSGLPDKEDAEVPPDAGKVEIEIGESEPKKEII